MKYVYKIIRISAWLLVLITLLVMISGFAPAKNSLLPNFLHFNYGAHGQLAIWGFLPLFYIHSLSGIIILLSRHKKLNKPIFKIIILCLWTAINLYFVYTYLAPIRIVNSKNNNPDNSVNIQNLVLSAAEIAKHNQMNDCWMIINAQVYNLSNYSSAHPGGVNNILNYCGQDGTNAYNTKNIGLPHSSYANQLLQNLYLGKLNEKININQLNNIRPNLQNLSPIQSDEENENETKKY